MSSRKEQRLKRNVTFIEDEVRQLSQALKESQKRLLKHTKNLKEASAAFGDQVDIGVLAEVHIVTFNFQDKVEKRDESVIAGVFSSAKKAKDFIKNDLSTQLEKNFEKYYDQKLSEFDFYGLEDSQSTIKARAMTSKGGKVFIKCQNHGVE